MIPPKMEEEDGGDYRDGSDDGSDYSVEGQVF